jgi:hypothetical protein
MENRMQTVLESSPETPRRFSNEALPIGEILEELLAQYQARFPGLRIAFVETPATAL